MTNNNINISGSVQGGNVNIGGTQTFGSRKPLTPKGRYEIDITNSDGETNMVPHTADNFEAAAAYANDILAMYTDAFVTRVQRRDRS